MGELLIIFHPSAKKKQELFKIKKIFSIDNEMHYKCIIKLYSIVLLKVKEERGE